MWTDFTSLCSQLTNYLINQIIGFLKNFKTQFQWDLICIKKNERDVGRGHLTYSSYKLISAFPLLLLLLFIVEISIFYFFINLLLMNVIICCTIIINIIIISIISVQFPTYTYDSFISFFAIFYILCMN